MSDVIVVGGGLVGTSLAFGLSCLGCKVTVLDEGDAAFRASRGNFGLVWVQNKGTELPLYAEWSRDAAAQWPGFARELSSRTGIDPVLHQPGGFYFCYTDEDLEARDASLRSIQARVHGSYPYAMLDRSEIRARLPAIGPEVVGASFTPMDGHVNPLKLMRSLFAACAGNGVTYRPGEKVERIAHRDGGFDVHCREGRYRAPKVVLSAGLGLRSLAGQVGLNAPVVPNRGQILVTERIKRFLDYPTNKIRQTDEGPVQLGDSVEDVGFDDSTTSETIGFIARRSVRTFPVLRQARLIRAWGALRVMTPDGFPIYQESATCPGAFVVTCHSGVTLAAVHADRIARWIALGERPAVLEALRGDRFAASATRSAYVN